MTKVIAITGPSGSGKTTIAKQLIDNTPHLNAILISEDNYYHDQSHLTYEQRLLTNYDEPHAYEHELLSQQLKILKQGEPVNTPVYCFKQHTREQQTITYHQPDLIVVEGLMLLTNPALLTQFELKVYIDTPIDICLLRRVNRDIEERGRHLESITQQYLSSVRPSLERYIEPSRTHADITLSECGEPQALIQRVLARLNLKS